MICATINHATPKAERPKPVLACDPKDTKTRQEFKKESDVNWLLKKYGGNIPMAQVRYGEEVFGVDRLQAIESIRAAHEAYLEQPEAVRAKYPDYESIYRALQDGTFSLPEAVSEAVSDAKEG